MGEEAEKDQLVAVMEKATKEREEQLDELEQVNLEVSPASCIQHSALTTGQVRVRTQVVVELEAGPSRPEGKVSSMKHWSLGFGTEN